MLPVPPAGTVRWPGHSLPALLMGLGAGRMAGRAQMPGEQQARQFAHTDVPVSVQALGSELCWQGCKV